MDEEQICRVMDRFMGRFKEEVQAVVRNVRQSTENAQSEIKELGFTIDNASGLFLELAAFEEIIEQGRKMMSQLCDHAFEELDELDPEEAEEVQRRIIERLKLFNEEFEKMMRG